MPISLNEALLGFALPAVAAALALLLAKRCLSGDMSSRYAPSLALLVGFMLGYQLLGIGSWLPTSHWHWLPYALVFAAVLGPVANAAGVGLGEKLMVYALAALVIAWQLAPTWANVDPAKSTQILICAAAVSVAAFAFDPLAQKSVGPFLPFMLAIISVCAAVVVVVSGSLRLGQLTGIGAGAMTGIAIAAALGRQTGSLTAISLPLFVFLTGTMWIGHVNSFSEVPTASYPLVAVSPLAYWICQAGPLSRMTGWRRTAVHAALSIAPAIIALALAASTISASDFEGIAEYSSYSSGP